MRVFFLIIKRFSIVSTNDLCCSFLVEKLEEKSQNVSNEPFRREESLQTH